MATICRKEGNKHPWGIVYSIVKEKIGKPTIWTEIRLSDGNKTTYLVDTIKALLRKCLPKDEITVLSAESRALKQTVESYTNMNLEPIISYTEINMAISTFENKKAPVLDNLKIEILIELWIKMPDAIYGVMNNCFNQGSLSRLWKQVNLKILLRDENKDWTSLNF